MEIEKQKSVLSILETGIYEIDTINAIVYANRKRGKVQLKPNLLPSMYQQLTIFKGRGTGIREIVYLHVLVYLAEYGLYPDWWEIDHVDRDKMNNGCSNLKAKDSKGNNANRKRGEYPLIVKRIRAGEIASIRLLLSVGRSQQSIAVELGLNRLSVRYIIKKIEAGEVLKYE